jgi:hypothetical protein
LPREFASLATSMARLQGGRGDAVGSTASLFGMRRASTDSRVLQVTKLDVLDTLDRIALCTGYRIDGQLYTEFPGDLVALENAEPQYEWLEGWQKSTAEARTREDLPPQAPRLSPKDRSARGCADNLCQRGHSQRSDHRRLGLALSGNPGGRRFATSKNSGIFSRFLTSRRRMRCM